MTLTNHEREELTSLPSNKNHMKRIFNFSLLLVIGMSMTLLSGCSKQASSGSATGVSAQESAEKEIQAIKDNKSMPEGAKTAAIDAIRKQTKAK